jgi:thioredoxin reductase (NADPH)
MSVRDLIIVGAGPSGLSAAIAAKQRSLDYVVLEQGVLVNSIYRFPPQMVFFTTPELLEVGGLPFVSPYDKPTRTEALRYYRRVVDTYDLKISFDETARSIEREEPPPGDGGAEDVVFAIETHSSRGVNRVRHGRFVVMAIGYFDHPNLIGVPGEDLSHVSHYYSDPHIHYRQRVVIVGAGNSAAESALEMFRAGAHVTLVHRGPQLKSTIKYWVRPDIENRIKEGSIAARFNTCLKEIRPTSVLVTSACGPREEPGPTSGPPRVGGDSESSSAAARASGGGAPRAVINAPNEEEIPADAVYLLTGYRADNDLICRAGVNLNERQAPIHDPNTFETNVPGLFVAGGATAGVDTGTIFIENGRFHGEKIVEVIASRISAL